jgi:hypothetical protein
MRNANSRQQYSEPLRRLYPTDFFPPQKCETFIPSPSGSSASALHNKHQKLSHIISDANKDTQDIFNKLYQSIKKASVLTERGNNRVCESTDAMLLSKLENKCNKIISITRQYKALKMLKPSVEVLPPIYLSKRYDEKENTMYNAFIKMPVKKRIQILVRKNKGHPRVLNPFIRIV